MNFEAISKLAEDLGLGPTARFDLQASRIEERKSKIFAAVPQLHGLRLWVNGEVFVLLDEKGFLCSTTEKEQVFGLSYIESTQGPGAVRELLSRPIEDPYAAITAFAPRFRTTPKQVEKSFPAPRASRTTISPSVLESLLKEI